MTRLLVATDNYTPRWDGISRFLQEIVPRLQLYYDITVAAPDFPPHADEPGVVRVPLKRLTVSGFTLAKWKWALMRRLVLGHDIVFSQTVGPVGAMALRYGHTFRKPTLAYLHALEWELVPRALPSGLLKRHAIGLMKRWSRYCYRKPSLIMVPSAGILDELTWQGIRTPKLVVHLGCDTAKFKPGDKLGMRERLGLPRNSLILGYHGRLSREKDLPTLLRAFTRVRREVADSVLLLVGAGDAGLTRLLSGRPGVVLVGSQNDVVPYLQAMDIYCLPSLTETTCLSVLEAMACELPVVSTPVGYVRDYIVDGENGLFFPAGDNYAMAQQILRLVRDKPLYAMIRRAARETVIRQFKWEDTVRGILMGIRAVSAKGGTALKGMVKTEVRP